MEKQQAEQNDLTNFEVEDDDKPVGRVLSRREVLALFGGCSALLIGSMHALAASQTIYLPIIAKGNGISATPVPTALTETPTATMTATPGLALTPTATATITPTPSPSALCLVRPEMTVGPYFVDEQLNRTDVREDHQGAELQLSLRVYLVANGVCTPLVGAFVDIWHCDAAGKYSDVASESTAGQTFLRGYQVTNNNGIVKFTTLYPGWYTGRAVHIHFKIRDALSNNPTQYHFISQFFFNEDLTTHVHSQAPYASKGTRDTLNTTDNIYQTSGGSQMVLPVVQSSSIYTATFDIGFVS